MSKRSLLSERLSYKVCARCFTIRLLDVELVTSAVRLGVLFSVLWM